MFLDVPVDNCVLMIKYFVLIILVVLNGVLVKELMDVLLIHLSDVPIMNVNLFLSVTLVKMMVVILL
jgi:hypothetical protein